ncbi:MAG TPA: VOC family protein [Candidatus Saccharimonadales bacterium]|nr:VOC family protein [Candidatus Saccharimonadales bacterium]
MQKIVPNFWFDTEVKDAVDFYCQVFPDSKITSDYTLHDTPGGDTRCLSFTLSGQDFIAINGGPDFKINPSISFILNFDPSRDEQAGAHLQEMWDKLAEGGSVFMPLKEYPFSKQYGWVQDKFGVSWQLMLTNPEGEPRPFIIPSLLFTGENTNKTEEAVQFYLSVFKNARQGTLARYTEDTGPAKKGSVLFTDFMLEGQWLSAMDAGVDQPYTFNEATSLLINCDTQEEIDYYWEKLSAVPESEVCGWLKDKYGISWQVSPAALNDMLADGTPEQVARVTQAFLTMKKIDLATLEVAFRG